MQTTPAPAPDRDQTRLRAIAVAFGVIGACAMAWALALLATGGLRFRWLGLPISSQDPARPLIIACLAAGVSLLGTWRQGGFDRTGRASRMWVRAGLTIAICAIGALTFKHGAFVAAGADASGYVSQSQLWASGSALHVEQPLARDVPWPDPEWTLSPLGYRPAPEGASIVPTYPPGLPILMAFGRLGLGEGGVYWVVPILAMLCVWLAFKLATALAGPLEGLATAWAVALSPIFLRQAAQPMSDVPATTVWLAALTLAWCQAGVTGAAASGLSTSLAILIRPNLVPLAVVVAGVVATGSRSFDARARIVSFLAGLVPGVLALALLNRSLYGSPLASGYGSFGSLFAWTNVGPNAVSYLRWAIDSETPWLALGLVAPLVVGHAWRPPFGNPKSLSTAVVVFAALNVALYLPYLHFDDWSYLRFLLPSVPLMYAALFASVGTVAARINRGVRVIGVSALAAAIAIGHVHAWPQLDVFGPGRLTPRFLSAADFVKRNTPDGAVIVCMEHSGSIRYYTGRPILRYDFLGPEWLDAAVDRFRRQGRPVLFVLDDWEMERFRARFATRSRYGGLGWKPEAVLHGAGAVFVFAADAQGSP